MNSNKIKIVHIQLLPLMSGVQRVTYEELKRLPDSQYDKYIICKEEGALTLSAKAHNVNCLYSDKLQRSISVKSDIWAFLQVFKILRDNRFDIVHTHSSKTGVLGRLAAKVLGVRLIVHTVHGYSFSSARSRFEEYLFKCMERFGALCSDSVICLHYDDVSTSKDVLGIQPSKLKTLPNGVDTEKFRPCAHSEKIAIRHSLGLGDSTVVIAMVGRLWPQKNPQLFVEAALKLLANNSLYNKVEFVLVGDGELKEQLENTVVQADLKEKIHFLGWRTDIDKLLKAFDIFVLPSLWEGMPLAILEAQSSGLPCVVSDIQGNRNLIDHGKDGFIFKSQDVDDLSNCLIKLASSHEIVDAFGYASRKKVLDKYDINVRVRNIDEFYKSHLM